MDLPSEQGGLQQALSHGAQDLADHDDRGARRAMGQAFDMYLSIWDNPEKQAEIAKVSRAIQENLFNEDTDNRLVSSKKPVAGWFGRGLGILLAVQFVRQYTRSH